ncbi:hypothetical protein SAMN04488027_10856 [Psychroflexus sediminis]|uniref:Uncharacterized protein n=1 Tax=Psychroflexus sediminis TaxID=470826 RepID=A0A1G7XE52_9FLAO|nr:hypothetical protein SAMN04488027_10856 [Psychroflexus sediminis]
MQGEVVNSSFLLLSKFGASRQESASKTATNRYARNVAQIKKDIEDFSDIPTRTNNFKLPSDRFKKRIIQNNNSAVF